MLSFRPELGSPGEYIYLSIGIYDKCIWRMIQWRTVHMQSTFHICALKLLILCKTRIQKGFRTGRIYTSYFMGWLIFVDCMKCTLSHMYCRIMGHFHLNISHPQTSLSWNTHTNKQIIWGSFRGRLGWFFFRDSVVILSKCLLFSNTVEYCIKYVQPILKGLGHEMNIF